MSAAIWVRRAVEGGEATFVAQAAAELQCDGMAVEVAGETEDMGFDGYGRTGVIDGGAVPYVDNRRMLFSVGDCCSGGVYPCFRNQFSGIGGEEVGGREPNGSSELLAGDHSPGKFIGVAEQLGSCGHVALVTYQAAYYR